MKILITKYSDKVKLVYFLRKLHRLSLKESFDLLKNLPITILCWQEQLDYFSKELNNVAEFEIIKSQEELDQEFFNKKYDEAEAFYNSLSNEDKEKIDLLIKMRAPVAMGFA